VSWEPTAFAERFDAALIVTDHDVVDYDTLVESMDLIVDARNATRHVRGKRERIVLA
jgi:UDP-N-acetyl-D-glucosamine dehydrogenase